MKSCIQQDKKDSTQTFETVLLSAQKATCCHSGPDWTQCAELGQLFKIFIYNS